MNRLSGLLVMALFLVNSARSEIIQIPTAHGGITLGAEADGRLYEYGFATSEYGRPKKGSAREAEFLPGFGDGFVLQPAVQATHADGNISTDLIYVNHTTSNIDDNITLTRIELKDGYYPFYATVCLKAYKTEDVIEAWTEYRHSESNDVVLYRFASSMPLVKAREYWLTQFHGDWAKEAEMAEEKLTPGLKVLDSKIGVRASQFRFPSFTLALDGSTQETNGTVIGGSLKWSGSYELSFEINSKNLLRISAGINPAGSQYHLPPGKVFTTPAMLWTWSDHGAGQVSRNFHDWARRYGIRDGAKPRPILLNNWEATRFHFTEPQLVSLIHGAKNLGANLFLLDDGWFANKYPRDNDHAGLGDWQVNTNKLPHGLSFLADAAKQNGIRFGIWLEPEMVNPKSELFEQHPDWALHQPHRDPLYQRNQLNLDLSNPAVKQYCEKIMDDTFGANPGISYVKWDANRFVTQPGSSYLPPERQSEVLIDYNLALYDVMAYWATNYPNVMGMLCSGGGGRADYGALKYFNSFWASDNTDPLKRVFIQWGYSHFFPANAVSAHVTRMGNRPVKFALDVAMSGAFGFDLDLAKVSEQDREYMTAAIKLYDAEIRDTVTQGDLYRLESPYDGRRSCIEFVSKDESHAVLFTYQLKDSPAAPVTLQGLDTNVNYTAHEVNLRPGTDTRLNDNGAVLRHLTITPPTTNELQSAVIILTANK